MTDAVCTTLNKIRPHDPCKEGWKKLLKYLGKVRADDEPLPFVTILESNGLEHALWCLHVADKKKVVLLAVKFARRVERLMQDQGSRDALDVAERWVSGKATDSDIASAARAAARAAYEAVREADAASEVADADESDEAALYSSHEARAASEAADAAYYAADAAAYTDDASDAATFAAEAAIDAANASHDAYATYADDRELVADATTFADGERRYQEEAFREIFGEESCMTDPDYTALVEQAKADGFVTVAMFAGIKARKLGLTMESNPFDHAGLRDYWRMGFLNGLDGPIPLAPVVRFPTPRAAHSHASRTHEFYQS